MPDDSSRGGNRAIDCIFTRYSETQMPGILVEFRLFLVNVWV